ncbi:MAG: hypothetical protein IT337_08850 [Thermomicrobiales bacterium]|nr:hypothetical protein [Thermomicrobiales bacterium]
MMGLGRPEPIVIPFILLICFVVGILPGAWTNQDAERRGASAALELIAWFVGTIVALIIWLIVRPPIPRSSRET